MPRNPNPPLVITVTADATVLPGEDQGTWTLKIPGGPKGNYRLAQLDDTQRLSREDFLWKPPVIVKLNARAAACDLLGTWGFGFWNDPFSLKLGIGGGQRRFPALPNATWFFYGSPSNHLTFRDDLPGSGLMAQTFKSPKFPALLMALGSLGLPFLFWPWLARRIRLAFRYLIAEDSFPLNIDHAQWHQFTLFWESHLVTFTVDGQTFMTEISPQGPLGFVLWIDNQYAAFSPNGKLSYGTLPYPHPAWLEIQCLSIRQDPT